MNKIYKVIWSKVKHQYVVVSELAHSNGKQSRTSRNSIRSRIAALVVCGAIAAFGVFSALPNSAFAAQTQETVTADEGVAQAKEYQYVAIKTDSTARTQTYYDAEHNAYTYHLENAGGVNYYVRDGYSIKIEYGDRYPGSASDKQVVAYKTNTDPNSDKGLLKSDQIMIEAAKNSDNQAITSFTGYVLNDVTAGTYVGATNQGGTQTPDDWNYFIQDSNGQYVDVSTFKDDSVKHPKFVEAQKQADGTYTINGNVVSSDNLYVLGEVTSSTTGPYWNPTTTKNTHYRLGAFVTSEGEIYTGRVFGKTNEVLMTAKDEDGTYYSYWAAPTDDPDAPITSMTMGQFNTALKEIDDNARGLAGDDIKQIDVKSNDENAGGTIGLLRRGNYNKDTGKWEGTEYAPGTITVTSEGGTNGSGKANDIKIKFASENGGSFTVDAGSKVEGLNSEGTATAGDTLTGIKINGVEYDLSQGKTYSAGNGIAINENDKNKISVKLKKGENNLTVDDSGLALSDNLNVASVTATNNIAANSMSVTEVGNNDNSVVKATTEVAAGTNVASVEKTKDETDGHTVYTVNAKGTEVTGDSNVEVTSTTNEETNVTSYNVKLKDVVNIGSGENKVTIDGNEGTVSGLSNTTWNAEGDYSQSTKAATEAQLDAVAGNAADINLGNITAAAATTEVAAGTNVASVEKTKDETDGHTVYTVNAKGTEVTGDSNVEVISTTNEETNVTSYNVTLNDNITLGNKSGTRIQLNGNPQKDSMISITNKDSDTVFNVAKDGTVHSDGDIVAKADSNKKYSLSEVGENAVRYNENKSTVALAGTNGTTITNVANGINEKDAVNVSQLNAVDKKVNAGWTAKVGDSEINVRPNGENETGKDTLKFAGDDNITVTADAENNAINVELNDDITLGEGNNQIRINGSDNNGGKIVVGQGQKTVEIDNNSITLNKSLVIDGSGDHGAIIHGLSNNNWNPAEKDNSTTAATEGQLYDVYDGSVKYWQNQDGTYDKSFIQLEGGEEGTTITHLKDGVVAEHSTEAINGSQLWETQQQIKDVETTANKHTIVSTTDDSNLTVKNVAKEGEADNYQVTLNDEVVLGDYFDKGNGVLISGNSGTISATNSITVGEDQGLVIDGQKKTIQGLSNTTWTGTTETPNRAATEGQLQNAYDGSVKYWRNEDGTYDKSFIQLEGGEEGTTITHLKDGVVAEYSTEAINGSQLWETQQQIKDVETTANKHTIVSTTKDSNLTVKNVAGEGEADNYQVALKDDITLKGDSSSIELTGTKGTIQVNQETAEGTNFTNINGNVVSIGYTNSEGIENAIVIDGGKGTITGLSNTTWDDELAKQVADSEELQGTAATQGQLQQAVSEVSGIVNKGWTAKAGDNDGEINITPGDTLNFEGDGNITVSATGGTSNELKFGLNDNITLGDKESTSITLYTDPTSETTVVGTDGNTTNVTGYVPESYKSGTGADFVKNNGGFALFTTDTQGHGIFGVTTKGTAHGKDFVTYTKDIYGNDTRYSLNDVGDAVAQMSSYYNGKNSYTVFSRYLNEAEKDNPFVTVDEDGNTINATRDIPLALRDDGAVLIGATIKGEDFTDNGIRINAETKTTYDKNGNEVTNNIATITGLENTEWKPPTPVATLAANDGSATVTSRAATESQLNDLYSAVAAYDVNVDGTIDYSHIALAGTPYGASRSGNGTPTGGTSITNVAYASGKDGSEAVNVDYLNDAINNAVKDGGAISDSDRHLQEGTYHVNDQGKVELIVADEKGENQSTVTIDNIANKNDITNLDNKIDNTFNDLNDKINNIDNVETDVKGGNINEDGTISLKTENEDGTTTNVTLKGQLTDSGVVQEGTTFDKETGTLTITSQDKYSGETSSVTVEGIASTEVVGATTKEDLATAYKDADKDGNATTEYITDSESMVEADVALDHAIQDVAGTSYANDMVLSNRIDSVEKRLGNVEERIDKVGAMAAAIANLRTMGFDPEAPTEIAIGVGQYKSETGIAIGVFHYPNQDFMLSASLSSSGDELMGGIGATWKLGRKSAAERAKDEEARHLEQAEEMKKLAQQEKVKAQAQRHAKLLAERQQASQKNA